MQRKTSLKELKEVDKVKWAKALFNWIIKAEIHSSAPPPNKGSYKILSKGSYAPLEHSKIQIVDYRQNN
jgi:hypothetical protein